MAPDLLELPNIEAATKLVEQGRSMEASVKRAAAAIRRGVDATAAEAWATASTEMASTITSSLEIYANAFEQLAKQNAILRSELELAQSRHVEDEESDDDSYFGSHLREAWSILRGK